MSFASGLAPNDWPSDSSFWRRLCLVFMMAENEVLWLTPFSYSAWTTYSDAAECHNDRRCGRQHQREVVLIEVAVSPLPEAELVTHM